MAKPTVVLGFGTVGARVARLLEARGETLIIAQRTRPADLPATAEWRACDVLDAASMAKALEGAGQVVLSIAFPYDTAIWRKVWPKAMRNVVEACAANGARVVFLDNLYMLGPQREPRREDMPLTRRGGKPAVLSKVTRIWMDAAKAGRVRFASLRCTDFYGPGVTNSHLGDTAFGRLARGKPALFIVPPDVPHDFAYVPDIARAIVTLLDAPDSDFNQVWNMPCAQTRTPREILALGAETLGVEPRLRAIPFSLLPLLGLAVPFLHEVADVGFTWKQPYIVDGRKFTERFGFEVTPLAQGAAETAWAFRS